jgi:hypothetical protein
MKKKSEVKIKTKVKCSFCDREFDDTFDLQQHFHNKHISDSFKIAI